MSEPDSKTSGMQKRAPTDMEAFAMTAKEVALPLVEAMNERTRSEERVAIHRLNKDHESLMYDKKSSNTRFYIVAGTVALLGGVGAACCYWAGKTELGTGILSATIAGLLGLVGGKALSA